MWRKKTSLLSCISEISPFLQIGFLNSSKTWCCSVISQNCPQATHFISYERQSMASEKQCWQTLYLSFFCATGFLNELANCSDLTHKELSHSGSQASNCAEMIMMIIIIMMIMGTGENGEGWESGMTSKRQMTHRERDQTLIQCKPTLRLRLWAPICEILHTPASLCSETNIYIHYSLIYLTFSLIWKTPKHLHLSEDCK